MEFWLHEKIQLLLHTCAVAHYLFRAVSTALPDMSEGPAGRTAFLPEKAPPLEDLPARHSPPGTGWHSQHVEDTRSTSSPLGVGPAWPLPFAALMPRP